MAGPPPTLAAFEANWGSRWHGLVRTCLATAGGVPGALAWVKIETSVPQRRDFAREKYATECGGFKQPATSPDGLFRISASCHYVSRPGTRPVEGQTVVLGRVTLGKESTEDRHSATQCVHRCVLIRPLPPRIRYFLILKAGNSSARWAGKPVEVLSWKSRSKHQTRPLDPQ